MQLPCALCDKPMFVGEGQLAFAHKQCRKEARKAGLKDAIRASERRFDMEQRMRAVQEVL